jgi:cytoskeletal protein CcmA (bactofilin family)
MADPIGIETFPTVLGPDATFKGELSFDKGMRLMGKFEGKITTPGKLQVS